MTGQLYLVYKELIYLLVYDKERIEIYSADNLEMIESIRNLYVDIVHVISVGEGNFIAITQREAVFYALSISQRKELFWKKMTTEVVEESIIGVKYGKINNQLILLSSNLIQSLNCKTKDDCGFIKQAELSLGWMVSVKQDLKSMDISEDEELLALLSEKGKIYIWNLRLIPTVFKKNMNLSELGQNSCSFTFDDHIQQLQFKISIRQNKNCLYALSKNHLRVLQQVRDGPSFSFVTLMSIRLHGLKNFIQISSSLSQTKLLPSQSLSVNNMQSVDPIILQINQKFVLYQFYSIRSTSMKAQYRQIKQLQLGFSKISNILFTNKKNLLVVGDQNQNICQMKLKLDEQIPIKQNMKVYFINIADCYFSQNSNFVLLKLDDGSYCRKNITFNNWLNSQPADPNIVKVSIKTTTMGCLHGDIFYFVENSLLHMHNIVTDTEVTIPCVREVKFISFLKELPTGLYFVFDGDLMILKDDKIQTYQRLVPAKQVIKIEVVPTSSSILFKTNRGYWLYQWFVEDDALKTMEIRKSSEHMIYGGGYWTQLRQTQILFGSGSKALVSFSLDLFLSALSKKHNLKGLKYKLGHLVNQVFTLQIQNYFFFLAVVLDIKKKRYYVNVLRKNAYSSDYLVIRIPRMASLQKTRLTYLNNCFYIWADKLLMIIGRYPQDPVGLDYQDFTQSVGYINASISQPVSIQNPYFLKQLLSMGLFNQVDAILQDLSIKIQQKPLDPFLALPCQTLAAFLNKQLGTFKLNLNTLSQDLKTLQNIVIQKPESTGLTDTLPLLLSDIVDFARFRLQNQRSLDLSSSVLISRARRLLSTKQKLTTRDVCWAMHTNNKEELFMYLIQQPLERKQQGLSWKVLKRFCVVLWYDDVSQIKKWIQKVALSEYRISKDAFDCLLWYVILGKKNVLLALLKKTEDTASVKTAEFLQRDFTQEKNKVAASKNAYALLSKKRYQHAIAFFILGGAYNDAITLCLNQLQDPLLAILICKVFKQQVGSQMIKQIYQKTLLQTGRSVGDPWMMHIAYYLLGQHIESYNCLFEDQCNFDVPTPISGAPIVCPSWKAQFQPQLSLFHPSILFFSNIVKQSLPFKRQLQQRQQQFTTPSNYQNFINHSIDYYIRLNIPQLSIALTIQNLETLSLTSYRKSKLSDSYLNRLIALVIKSGSVRSSLNTIKQISSILQTDETKMLENFEKFITSIDCGELLFDFYIQTENIAKAKQYVYNFKNQLVHFMLYRNNSRLQTSQSYLIAFHMIYWGQKVIDKCIENKLQVKDFQIYICMLKIIILLRLEQSANIFKLTNQLIDLLAHKQVEIEKWDDSVYEILIKQLPSRTNRFQTVKASKKMDILQENFRKTVDEEITQTKIPSETNLVFLAFKKIFFELLLCKVPPSNYLNDIVNSEKNRANEQLSIFISAQRLQAIFSEFLQVVISGSFSWAKTQILSSNNIIDKDQIIPVLQLLNAQPFLVEKTGAYKFEQLLKPSTRQNVNLRESIFKNGIEIFKYKSEPMKSFVLNNLQGSQNQGVILFKRSLRKFDVYHSLLNRSRNNEGCCLTDQDSVFYPNQPLKASGHSPLVNTCYDILKCNFSKRIYGAVRYQKIVDLHMNGFMKQLDQVPFVNHNQLNSIASHRYLPLFFIGGRSNIDIYSFSNVKNFNKIVCKDLSDITKISTNYTNELIGAIDSDGTFSSMHFNSSYSGAQSLLVKKSNVIDFCYLNSNIVATGCKDGAMNVYDPLLHPNRNIVFKQKLQGLSFTSYLPKSNVIITNRRTQLCTYDIRRGMLDRIQIGNQISSLVVDPYTNYIYVGTSYGQIKILLNDGSQLATLKAFKNMKKPPSIIQMRVARGNLFALSNDGVLSYAFS